MNVSGLVDPEKAGVRSGAYGTWRGSMAAAWGGEGETEDFSSANLAKRSANWAAVGATEGEEDGELSSPSAIAGERGRRGSFSSSRACCRVGIG